MDQENRTRLKKSIEKRNDEIDAIRSSFYALLDLCRDNTFFSRHSDPAYSALFSRVAAGIEVFVRHILTIGECQSVGHAMGLLLQPDRKLPQLLRSPLDHPVFRKRKLELADIPTDLQQYLQNFDPDSPSHLASSLDFSDLTNVVTFSKTVDRSTLEFSDLIEERIAIVDYETEVSHFLSDLPAQLATIETCEAEISGLMAPVPRIAGRLPPIPFDVDQIESEMPSDDATPPEEALLARLRKALDELAKQSEALRGCEPRLSDSSDPGVMKGAMAEAETLLETFEARGLGGQGRGDLQAENERLREEVEGLRMTIDQNEESYRAESKATETEMYELRGQCNNLQKENGRLRGRRKQLNEDRDRLQGRCNRLREERDGLLDVEKESTAQISRRKSQIDNLRLERTQLEAKQSDYEEQIARRDALIARLRSERDDFQARAEEAQRERDDSEGRAEGAQRERDEANAQNSALEAQIEALQNKLEKVQNRAGPRRKSQAQRGSPRRPGQRTPGPVPQFGPITRTKSAVPLLGSFRPTRSELDILETAIGEARAAHDQALQVLESLRELYREINETHQ
jgi:septal ring factor EnvC (AmiA/AmiB activator)